MALLTLAVSRALQAVAGALLAGLALAYLARTFRRLWLTRDFPGPTSKYLIGNVPELLDLQRDFLKGMKTLHATYGPTLRAWLGPFIVVCLSEPEDLDLLFNHPDLQHKTYIIYHGFKLLSSGDGVLSISGEPHKLHRKAMKGPFSVKSLRTFVPAIEKRCCEFLAKVEAFVGTGEVFNATPPIEDTSVNVLLDATFGEEPVLERERETLSRWLEVGDIMIVHMALRPWFHWAPIRAMLFNRLHELRGLNSAIVAYMSRAVASKEPKVRARREDREDYQHEEDHIVPMIDHFIASKEFHKLDVEDMAQSLMHSFIAGAATSNGLIMISLLVLALKPEVQERIREEQDEVLGPHESLSDAALSRMQYLERVLKETLRLFPQVHTIGRVATDDVKLPSGKVVPKDTIVVYNFSQNNLNPRWYKDPLKFDPDRFLPENCTSRPVYVFTPFSAGSRNCVGLRFGMMYVKSFLSLVVRRYRVLPDPNGPQTLADIKYAIGVSLHPEGGTRIRLEPRP